MFQTWLNTSSGTMAMIPAETPGRESDDDPALGLGQGSGVRGQR